VVSRHFEGGLFDCLKLACLGHAMTKQFYFEATNHVPKSCYNSTGDKFATNFLHSPANYWQIIQSIFVNVSLRLHDASETIGSREALNSTWIGTSNGGRVWNTNRRACCTCRPCSTFKSSRWRLLIENLKVWREEACVPHAWAQDT
jgi:hypothetical protein